MVMVDYLTEGVYTEKLQVADGLSVTSPNRRNWLCNPMGVEQPMSAGSIFAAFIPAILVSILIFMEVEFTGVILDKKDHKLKKGMGYNLDLFVLALMVGLCSILGLPWMCATPVHTLSHFHALKVMSTNHAPGEHPCLLEVREQRLTNILIHLLIGFNGPSVSGFAADSNLCPIRRFFSFSACPPCHTFSWLNESSCCSFRLRFIQERTT